MRAASFLVSALASFSAAPFVGAVTPAESNNTITLQATTPGEITRAQKWWAAQGGDFRLSNTTATSLGLDGDSFRVNKKYSIQCSTTESIAAIDMTNAVRRLKDCMYLFSVSPRSLLSLLPTESECQAFLFFIFF
jgi:hypothetical protein